jgi:hypothetical protein
VNTNAGMHRPAVALLALVATLLTAGPALAGAGAPQAQAVRAGEAEVRALLQEFLAKVTSPAMHERFWAEDVIYVSNAGIVRTKADILKGMKAEEPTAPTAGGTPAASASGGYSGEDVIVRQFGEVVVVNFRLVQHTAGKPDTSFRNTGVFVKRDGRWQAVSWQATRVPPPVK